VRKLTLTEPSWTLDAVDADEAAELSTDAPESAASGAPEARISYNYGSWDDR
jgi:hypothetical protein